MAYDFIYLMMLMDLGRLRPGAKLPMKIGHYSIVKVISSWKILKQNNEATFGR